MNIRIKKGDLVIWRRSSGPVEGEVLEVKAHPDGQQAVKLAIKGWLGTHWEKVDYTFAFADAWCPDAVLRAEIIHRVADNIPLSSRMRDIVNQA